MRRRGDIDGEITVGAYRAGWRRGVGLLGGEASPEVDARLVEHQAAARRPGCLDWEQHDLDDMKD
jgi:hypothetical protein